MTTSEPRYVYRLKDPGDGTTRYVGCSVDPAKRPAMLTREAIYTSAHGTPRSRLYQWLLSLRDAGKTAVVEVVGHAGVEWRAAERAEIQRLLAAGVPLLNTHRNGVAAK